MREISKIPSVLFLRFVSLRKLFPFYWLSKATKITLLVYAGSQITTNKIELFLYIYDHQFSNRNLIERKDTG